MIGTAHPVNRQRLITTLVVMGTLGLAGLAGVLVATMGMNAVGTLAGVGIVLVLMYVIFQQPYIGLSVIVGLLPVDSLLPKITIFTSLFPVIGGITILAYVYERHKLGQSIMPRQWYGAYVFGLLFVFWIFFTNPEAALKQGRGVALMTFFQLWVLIVLAAETMAGDSRKHRVLMWIYVIGCVVSAYTAIAESSGASDAFDVSGGTGGLSGINSNARQFTVGFMLLFYLRSNLKGGARWLILATWVMQLILLQGVSLTGSRTGVIIVFIGVVLMLLSPTSKIKPQRVLVPVIVAAAIYIAVPSSYWDSMFDSIFPTLQEGDDTLATRYELWETAMRMVADKPFTGVGINQFQSNVRRYSDPLSSTVVVLGAHSIYFSVIAETGIPGFIIYMGVVISAAVSAVRTSFLLRREDTKNLAYVWFVILILLLIGGLTKQDQFDKLLWLVFGMCTCMNYYLRDERASAALPPNGARAA